MDSIKKDKTLFLTKVEIHGRGCLPSWKKTLSSGNIRLSNLYGG